MITSQTFFCYPEWGIKGANALWRGCGPQKAIPKSILPKNQPDHTNIESRERLRSGVASSSQTFFQYLSCTILTMKGKVYLQGLLLERGILLGKLEGRII